jgi:U4/U6.U5 tri-snRNP-associated protein 1
MVTENNGEISCSVEETNRIRALLGLKPLNTARANKEQEAVDNFHNAAK